MDVCLVVAIRDVPGNADCRSTWLLFPQPSILPALLDSCCNDRQDEAERYAGERRKDLPMMRPRTFSEATDSAACDGAAKGSSTRICESLSGSSMPGVVVAEGGRGKECGG